MSNTPETDAMLHDCGDEYDPSMHPHSEGDWVQACFARKLERERDEWKSKYFAMRELVDIATNVAERWEKVALREANKMGAMLSGGAK